jgi:DNA repair exonuclease SbcCD nuclease subunit
VRDDYLKVLLEKLSWITELGENLGVPILQAGDLFDHWSQPSAVLNAIADVIMPGGGSLRNRAGMRPGRWVCTIGQHDLPNHNLEQIADTAWYNMELSGAIEMDDNGICDCYAWGNGARTAKGRDVALAHVSTWMKPYAPNQAPNEAMRTLRRFTKCGYKVVVTGDNHSRFYYADRAGKLLVNPGSVMRMTADQANHVPAVTIIYIDSDGKYRLEHRIIPIEDNVRASEVESVSVMDERIETFVRRLGESKDVALSFKDNIKRIAKETNASADIISLLKECTKQESA